MPISWRGTLAQYAGRLHRLHAAKREVVIYDYVDASEPVFARMAERRHAGYRGLGYTIASETPLGL
jgi:superfamily II DNA or RNA helicase